MSYLRALVYQQSAIVIEPRQDYLLEARLLPVAKEFGLADVSALVGHLRGKPANANGLQLKVVEAMTTNETTFFRDTHPFTMLKTHVFPQLLVSRTVTRTLNIWCGAASTGQESYSVAMLVKESFPELSSWKVRFVATDLCNAVLDRAREGIYKQVETNRGLPAALLVKYFERHGQDYRLKVEATLDDGSRANGFVVSLKPPTGFLVERARPAKGQRILVDIDLTRVNSLLVAVLGQPRRQFA